MTDISVAHRYSYGTFWSDEDNAYVATVAEMPSLSWVADTEHEALNGIKDLVLTTVAEQAQAGKAVPEPFSAAECDSSQVTWVCVCGRDSPPGRPRCSQCQSPLF